MQCTALLAINFRRFRRFWCVYSSKVLAAPGFNIWVITTPFRITAVVGWDSDCTLGNHQGTRASPSFFLVWRFLDSDKAGGQVWFSCRKNCSRFACLTADVQAIERRPRLPFSSDVICCFPIVGLCVTKLNKGSLLRWLVSRMHSLTKVSNCLRPLSLAVRIVSSTAGSAICLVSRTSSS